MEENTETMTFTVELTDWGLPPPPKKNILQFWDTCIMVHVWHRFKGSLKWVNVRKYATLCNAIFAFWQNCCKEI